MIHRKLLSAAGHCRRDVRATRAFPTDNQGMAAAKREMPCAARMGNRFQRAQENFAARAQFESPSRAPSTHLSRKSRLARCVLVWARIRKPGAATASPTMETNMSEWNDTGQSLPNEREYVQFAVADRRFLSYGTFSENRFRSRWGAYQPAEVRWWRRLGPIPSAPSLAQTKREHRYWSDRPMREA